MALSERQGRVEMDLHVGTPGGVGAVLAPVEPSAPLDEPEYLVPPGAVSDELLGLAHLYVLDRHPTTYRLSDALGDRRLSCYWGALRIYMPTFSCADSGSEHPLLVRDRVEHLEELGRVQAAHLKAMAELARRRQEGLRAPQLPPDLLHLPGPRRASLRHHPHWPTLRGEDHHLRVEPEGRCLPLGPDFWTRLLDPAPASDVP